MKEIEILKIVKQAHQAISPITEEDWMILEPKLTIKHYSKNAVRLPKRNLSDVFVQNPILKN
jgi:hypothetical protein